MPSVKIRVCPWSIRKWMPTTWWRRKVCWRTSSWMWTNPRNFSIRKPWRLKESRSIVGSSKGDKCMPADTPACQNSISDIPLIGVFVCHFHIPLCASHLPTHPWVTYFCVLLLSSVKNLHDRWAKDCSTFRGLYNQKIDLELKPKFSWGPLLDEKQVSYKINCHFFFSSQTSTLSPKVWGR